MIQQVAFEVPTDIALKLAAGEYVQYGGVVRDLGGHIVKHLKPANIQEGANAAQKIAAQAVNLAKQNKKVAIGALAVAGVATVGGAIYAGVTHFQHKQEQEAHKARIDAFNEALSEYVKALGEENLTVENIDALEGAMSALDAGEEGFTVEIEGEQFKNLVNSIRKYTDRLSKANGGKASNVIFNLFEKKPNDMAGLRECLATQREILAQAA
ncbi:MAG: hypothetical protein Q4B45_10595 [Coriobacteriia bacterium]|nr:hypothetical protein [Coriobacteriia bacterium]